MVVRVKICGLTREEDVDAAVAAGADAVGFIVGFEYSPRNLTMKRAAGLIQRVPPSVDSVLVTTSDLVSRERAAVRRIRPNAIQLYGDAPDPKTVRDEFGAMLIRPYLMKSPDVERARGEARHFDALLTDTYRKGVDGGTGATSDWSACLAVRMAIEPVPMILSGGLNPENVASAIEKVRPFAVDSSSGVESSAGKKDPNKVKKFIARARGVGGS